MRGVFRVGLIHLVRQMRVTQLPSAFGRSCAALVCAALVANTPLVLEASTYQPTSEVQQLGFGVLSAGSAGNQLIFPSELIAATGAPAKPMLTSAERAERAAKELAEAKANAPSKVAAKQAGVPGPALILSLTQN